MAFKYYIFLLATLAAVCLSVGSCSKSELYGQELSDIEPISLAALQEHHEKYDHQIVKIKGEIISECPSGCWFDLNDGTGQVYVDIKPNGLAIPQKIGSEATVEGRAIMRDGRLMIVGRGVEVK